MSRRGRPSRSPARALRNAAAQLVPGAVVRAVSRGDGKAGSDAPSFRRFAQIGSIEDVLNETTTLSCRRLLETHGLAEQLFEEVNAHLAPPGKTLRSRTIVEITIIPATSSTKTDDGERSPEDRPARQGSPPFLRMKAPSGVDVASGFLHHVARMAAEDVDAPAIA